MAFSPYTVGGADHLRATYRYLRLSMIVLIVTLFISVIFEINGDAGWLGSISAYYYTPVHAVFIGALIAIGVNLITIKGRNAAEEVLLNIAGALAFIVALVPTAANQCGADNDSPTCVTEVYVAGTDDLIGNNVLALLLGLAFAVAFIVGFLWWARRRSGGGSTGVALSTIISFGSIVAFVIIGLLWWTTSRDSFEDHAHGVAAVALFVGVWFAVLANTGTFPPSLGAPPETLPESDGYRKAYRMVLAAMLVVAALGGGLMLAGSDHWIFWLEVGEILCLAAYWLIQTVEGWDDSDGGRARAA